MEFVWLPENKNGSPGGVCENTQENNPNSFDNEMTRDFDTQENIAKNTKKQGYHDPLVARQDCVFEGARGHKKCSRCLEKNNIALYGDRRNFWYSTRRGHHIFFSGIVK